MRSKWNPARRKESTATLCHFGGWESRIVYSFTYHCSSSISTSGRVATKIPHRPTAGVCLNMQTEWGLANFLADLVSFSGHQIYEVLLVFRCLKGCKNPESKQTLVWIRPKDSNEEWLHRRQRLSNQGVVTWPPPPPVWRLQPLERQSFDCVALYC